MAWPLGSHSHREAPSSPGEIEARCLANQPKVLVIGLTHSPRGLLRISPASQPGLAPPVPSSPPRAAKDLQAPQPHPPTPLVKLYSKVFIIC